MKLYVGNISFTTTNEDLAEAFGQHGTVTSAQVASNRCRAAAELGISRMALYNKLHKYGLLRRSS